MKILSKETWSQIIDLICVIIKAIIHNGKERKNNNL